MWSVTTRPSTASPRNSSRSFDASPAFSAHHERCASARASSSSVVERRARAARSSAASSALARQRLRSRSSPSSADDVVDGVADGLQVLEVLVVDAEADACARPAPPRAPRPARSAPASRRRGRRRTTSPSVMPAGSISRMSASRSRISSNTCVAVQRAAARRGSQRASRPAVVRRAPTLCACERRRAAQRPTAARSAADQVGLDHLGGHPHGVDDRPGRRRAVADDAHAVDAEEHGAAGGLGVEAP